MRQIYIFAFFLLPLLAFSQLTIKPFENSDAYVYVENELLFVEKEINLISNPGNNPKANIYLRNEAQLLQGTTNAENNGNGSISVFQEGNATNFTYNYWSSPVSNVNNNSFGSIFFDPITKTDSNPAIITNSYDGLSKPLTISNKWIFKFTGSEYSDWDYIGDTFNIKSGEGFTMKGVNGVNTETILYNIPNNSGNKQRYDFRGKPNSGNYELSIKEDDIKLIGNPYPSAFDLNSFLQDNSNTTGIAYFWDSTNTGSHYLKEYEGGYGTYSPGVGIYGYVPAIFTKFDGNGNITTNTNLIGNYYARRYSPIGQGFMVIGYKDGAIVFDNKYRSFIKEDQLFSEFKARKTSKNKNETEEIPLLRLNIQFQNKYIRQILLALRENSTKEADHAMDAINPEYLSSDVGWQIENENYLINVRPLDELEEIPLYMVMSEATEVIFEIAELIGINSEVYVLDTSNNTYYNLKTGPVKICVDAGEYPERFKITYTNKDQVYVDWEYVKDIENFSIFQNNPESRLEVRIPAKSNSRNILLFDSLGKKIMEKNGITNDAYHEFSTRKLSKGLYIIKITNSNGTVVSKKVIISN